MPCLGVFGLEIYNTILIFEISTINFVKLQNFVKKTKMSKLGTKSTFLGSFWVGILKELLSYLK